MQLLNLKNISVDFGGEYILDRVNLSIQKNDRLCILGRNGAGKSTLLKVISGQLLPDEGERLTNGHTVVTTLPQEVPSIPDKTVYEVLSNSFRESHYQDWEVKTKIDTALTKLELDGESYFDDLSGGYKRRVLLANALAGEPDVLLMDEPTNHLDLSGINWLEKFTRQYSGAIVFITHDREFLSNIANRIIELDRGNITEYPGDYQRYQEQKLHALAVEDAQNKKFDDVLKKEEAWIRQGIKARRTRNEGRVRNLKKLRDERKARREKQKTAGFSLQKEQQSGKLVLQAENISYNINNKKIIDHFSLTLLRGDKIAIIGDNGCGKSTLIKTLLDELPVSEGQVKLGTKLEIAWFDQHRTQLDLDKTVADNVSYGDQFVKFGGKNLHIISYLKQFLFTPEQANSLVSKLSGGEKNRLLLARLFSKPVNFLILDEPTNDLDLETLELLEDLLVNFTGTLLLVSHDRSFIDNVATSTLVFESQGKITEYIGGYQDYCSQFQTIAPKEKQEATKKTSSNKENYQRQKLIRSLEVKIESLETKIKSLEEMLGDAALYEQGNEQKLTAIQEDLQKNQQLLAKAYAEWELLV